MSGDAHTGKATDQKPGMKPGEETLSDPALPEVKTLNPPEGTPSAEHRDFASRRFVLATDLDGTFLGGSEADRRALYEWIDANRDEVGLIFVTGRDPEFLEELCRGPVPWPDYVVGDVGTTIARMEFSDDEPGQGRVRPIEALEEQIAAIWDDAGPRVRAALDGHPGLTLQPTPFRYRVSYDYDPETFDPSAIDIVKEIGHDPLISADIFFDVLPRGVSKGPSLLRLLAFLGVAEHKTLAAGDTLNDLSMLDMDVPAVAVGNSEPGLVKRLRDRDTLHRAQAHGAGGILEAIAALGLHPSPPSPQKTAA